MRITSSTGHAAHPVEAFAFRFEHDGQVLAYSGDTGPSAVLVEVDRSADVLLCEAGFLADAQRTFPGPISLAAPGLVLDLPGISPG